MDKLTQTGKMMELEKRLESLEDQLKAPGDANTMSNCELTAAVRRLDSLIGSALISLTRRVSELEADNKNRVSEIGNLENMILGFEERPAFTGDQLDEVCRLKKELEVTQQNLDTYIERFEEQEKKLQAAARAFEAHGYKHPQGVFDQFEDKGDAEIKRLEDELESVGDGLKRTQGRLDMEKIWANLLYNGLKDAKNALQDESASNFGARKKALDIILGINNDPNLYRVESDRKDQQ